MQSLYDIPQFLDREFESKVSPKKEIFRIEEVDSLHEIQLFMY